MAATIEEAHQLQVQSTAEDLADLEARKRANERHCRVCGCTEKRACNRNGRPCFWLEEDFCSGCASVEELALFCEWAAADLARRLEALEGKEPALAVQSANEVKERLPTRRRVGKAS